MTNLFELLSQAGFRHRPIEIDVGRQLFIDDYLIADTNLVRRFHRPAISPNSPVISPETPLELNHGVMPATHFCSDGLWFDPEDRLYKMWYMAGYDDALAYATSTDGINWNRQPQHIDGTNRVLEVIPGYRRSGGTVWLDHDAQSAGERYKLFMYYRRTDGNWPRGNPVPMPSVAEMAVLYTSPDGRSWQRREEAGPCGDNSSIFYNPFRGEWVFSVRSHSATRGRLRTFVTREHLVGQPAWTADDLRPLAAADHLDRPDAVLNYRPELYKMDCVAYESVMIGMFAMFYGPPNEIAYREKIPKTIDLQVGFSRDGLSWNRPNREAFIACSRAEGRWDRGYLHAAGGVCVVAEDELRFYYSGFSGRSPAQGEGPYAGAHIGYATLRRDGFASMVGPGIRMVPPTEHPVDRGMDSGNGGHLVTRELIFSGEYLFLNAAVSPGGRLRVGLLEFDGSPVAGFALSDCDAISGNSTRHAVTWRGGSSLKRFSGTSIRLIFQFDAGELFSFWVSESTNGASKGYVGAGGAGFTSNRDTTGA